MRRRVITQAYDDMERARRYLNQQTDGLGERFLEDLAQVLERILEQPESFPFLETLDEDTSIRRAILTTFFYIVTFEVLADEVVVLAVAHQRRSAEPWIRRRS